MSCAVRRPRALRSAPRKPNGQESETGTSETAMAWHLRAAVKGTVRWQNL